MEDERSSLGDKLRALRKDRHESLVEAAAAIGISRTHLNNIELGHDNPGWGTALALAAYYGCSLDWLTSVSGEIKAGSTAAASEREALLLYLFRETPEDEGDLLLKMLFGRVRPKGH